jgi:hypothetical protein
MWLDGGEIANFVLNTVGQYPKMLTSWLELSYILSFDSTDFP